MASTYTPDDQKDNFEVPAQEQVAVSSLDSEELGLLDLLLVLVNHRRAIFRTTVLAVIVGLIVSLSLPKIYTGRAVILTPQKPISVSDMLAGDLAGLVGLTSASDALGLTDPNSVYVAMLTSDTVADSIIDQFHLASLYKSATHVETVKTFEDNLTVTSGQNGTITIEFEDKDPNRAAAVANAVVEQLQQLTQRLALDEAAQRRQFFGSQFKVAQQELARAEDELKQSQETSGMLNLDKQTEAIVESVAMLKGQIAAQEILIRGMKAYATDRNPSVVVAQQQLAGMKTQLNDLERRHQSGNGDIFVSTKNIPASGLTFLRRLRDVKYYEAVFEALGRQYEAAVIDEATSGSVMQVVDKATPPDKKTKPKRALIVLGFLFLGFFGSYAWALGSQTVARLELHPVHGPKVRRIKDGLPTLRGLRAGWSRLWQRRRKRDSD